MASRSENPKRGSSITRRHDKSAGSMHESKEDKLARFTSRRGYIVSVTKGHTASFIAASRRRLTLIRSHLNFYNRFLGFYIRFSSSCQTIYFFRYKSILRHKILISSWQILCSSFPPFRKVEEFLCKVATQLRNLQNV